MFTFALVYCFWVLEGTCGNSIVFFSLLHRVRSVLLLSRPILRAISASRYSSNANAPRLIEDGWFGHKI